MSNPEVAFWSEPCANCRHPKSDHEEDVDFDGEVRIVSYGHCSVYCRCEAFESDDE